jgi:5-methylcytosine-specific restriction enzyme subunit McrC
MRGNPACLRSSLTVGQEAVLVYPDALSKPLDAEVGGIRVRSLVFSLDGDLDQAGRAFMGDVLRLENLQ